MGKTLTTTTNPISGKESKSLIIWISYICFAYHYKVIICGFFGKDLGYTWLCHTLINGITTNHWFEYLVYVPVFWYACYRIITIAFGPREGEILPEKQKRLKTVAMFLLAMYIYGYGMHFINVAEINARMYTEVDNGPLYELVFWLDEQFTHWVQFLFYFLLFSWLIAFDRLDRIQGSYMAVFTGLLHGMERAIGVIEGDNPYLSLVLGLFILGACFYRWFRHSKDFPRVWKDFFFRHGLSFGITMPLAIFLYQLVFDGFIQPSQMEGGAIPVVVFVIVFTVIGLLLTIFLDRFLAKNRF